MSFDEDDIPTIDTSLDTEVRAALEPRSASRFEPDAVETVEEPALGRARQRLQGRPSQLPTLVEPRPRR